MSDLSTQQSNQLLNMQSASKLSGRKVLLLLAVIFVLPFTIAATLHFFNLHPKGKSYGDLITPPKPVNNIALRDMQGNEFKPQQWLKKWSMVTIDSTGCLQACQAQTHLLKQLHTSLDKDIKRVQRIMLVPAAASVNKDAYIELQKKYPDLIILFGHDGTTMTTANDFANAQIIGDGAINQTANPNAVWLVDPLGNIMMNYNKNQNPKGMQTDMKRLLKNSWAG